MKIWVTKYWQTKGIQKYDNAIVNEEYPGMARVKFALFTLYLHGKDWWRTPEEAMSDVLRRQAKLIASLKKRIKKIEAIKF